MTKINVSADDLRKLRSRAANLDAFADLACDWADAADVRILALLDCIAAADKMREGAEEGDLFADDVAAYDAYRAAVRL